MRDSLRHAQAAAIELRGSNSSLSLTRLSSFSRSEGAEDWLKFEQLFYSCLATENDQEATSCLDLLQKRFGADNERVQSLRSVYEEYHTSGRQSEELHMKLEKTLKETPANVAVAKRNVALLQSLDKESEAITALCRLLDLSQTDVEAWAELAELYQKRALYKQAIFCLEEILLVQPNAWNIHARIGELAVKQTSALVNDESAADAGLVVALQHFCRSVELCDDYVRGYCGLKLCTGRLLTAHGRNQTRFPEPIPLEDVQKLHDHASQRLRLIVDKYPKDGEIPPEIRAARLVIGR